MDRRWGMRKPVGVDVVIDNQPSCLLPGRIGNVSVGGLFVQTEAASLNPNARVEIVLMLQQGNGTSVYRMPAMVVRLTPNGAGLRFDEYDVNAFRALVVLLLAERRTSTSAARAPSESVCIESGTSARVSEGRTDAPARVTASSATKEPSPADGE
ncbi:MAG: PilZ domain-containing protein [Sulfurifustaceae bacterium]